MPAIAPISNKPDQIPDSELTRRAIASTLNPGAEQGIKDTPTAPEEGPVPLSNAQPAAMQDPMAAFNPQSAVPSEPMAAFNPKPIEPLGLPEAFSNRIASGQLITDTVKKEGGRSVLDQLLGLTGPRFQLWPEKFARGFVGEPKDITDQVTTGPGLRKEDFSDDPDAPEPLDALIQRSFEYSKSVLLGESWSAGFAGTKPIIMMKDGNVARLVTDADGTMKAQPIGKPPTAPDFENAAKNIADNPVTDKPVNPAVVSENLQTLWKEQGLHPAEIAHDAESDAFLRHDLGAAAAEPTDMPPLISPAEQPLTAAGRLTAALNNTSEKLLDIGRDIQMKVSPMTRGNTETISMAKDFASSMRRNRWDWARTDQAIVDTFDAESRKIQWEAADEESVLRQEGKTSEHMGLARLKPEERANVEDLQQRAQTAWLRARDLGMVEGEGLPAYTPRMILNVAEGMPGNRPIPLNGIGANLRVKTRGMLHREYLTAEETEAAAKKALGEGAELARDIRTLPLATAKLEDAIAGRKLINDLKDIGKKTGSDMVAEGGPPAGSAEKWFTMDHPAFRTWRPKFEEGKTVKDADGNIIFEQVPLYVHESAEGPLRAVLSTKSGPFYQSLMSLKGKTMSLIMNSPAIHNAVEFGRAFPAMPTRIFKAYFDGNRAKNDPAIMHEAIDAGLVPIGKRFFNQDITSIMEAPDLTPGRSLFSKILSAVPGLFDPKAEIAVKKAVDKAGDFWHNTLLWDRIADLQAGLYVNLRGDLMLKGVDQVTSSRVAAHFANRFAGALPQEAMSAGARKVANFMMFSRTFTLGNLGVMKDVLTGLPKDVIAQIERDAGVVNPEALGYAKALARRKAFSTVMMDIGLLYVGNSIMQSALNIMLMDGSIEEEMHGYAQRARDQLNKIEAHPLSMLQPFDLVQGLSATAGNEPGKQDRLKIGYTKEGTAIYARSPFGKIGEEFTGYLSGPLDMMRRKEGTIARPMMQVFSNDKGFGRKIYDPNAETPAAKLGAMWNIIEHLGKAQTPEQQVNGFVDLVKGDGDPKLNALRTFGPVAGVTFSQGAPGGPAIGELFHAREMHNFQVDRAMPDIRKMIQRGDLEEANQAMSDLGIPPALRRFYTRTTVNPATRLSPRVLRDFNRYATPEQIQRLESARGQ